MHGTDLRSFRFSDLSFSDRSRSSNFLIKCASMLDDTCPRIETRCVYFADPVSIFTPIRFFTRVRKIKFWWYTKVYIHLALIVYIHLALRARWLRRDSVRIPSGSRRDPVGIPSGFRRDPVGIPSGSRQDSVGIPARAQPSGYIIC